MDPASDIGLILMAALCAFAALPHGITTDAVVRAAPAMDAGVQSRG